MRRAFITLAVACAACGGGGSGSKPDADVPADPDIPPTGFDAMQAWIGSGFYTGSDWTCEPAAHVQEFPSNHGMNRTCNNMILHADATGSGPLPIDSASVKELYDDDGVNIIGYAVSRKNDDSGANGWYWYQTGGNPTKMEQGEGTPVNDCIACHACAPRDFTYAIIKPD